MSDDCSTDNTKNIKKDFPDGNKIVIISLYKYKDIYNIYKKLNTLKNVEIYDLVS